MSFACFARTALLRPLVLLDSAYGFGGEVAIFGEASDAPVPAAEFEFFADGEHGPARLGVFGFVDRVELSCLWVLQRHSFLG